MKGNHERRSSQAIRRPRFDFAMSTIVGKRQMQPAMSVDSRSIRRRCKTDRAM